MYIKLKSDVLVQDIVGRTFEANFKFDKGTIVKVQISEANGKLKYVRVFNLIPEVEDEHIANALKEYGTVKKQVREKFPATFGVDIFTGVRGVYMEISKPLPPYMSIGNLRAKFYYQGMTEGCFFCNGTDHVKLNCPKKISPVSRAQMQRHPAQPIGLYQQQPRQTQQAPTIINSPLHFPSFANILQQNKNSTSSEDGQRLFAPNNTLMCDNPENNEETGPVETPTTSNENMENDVEIESDQDESEGESSEVVVVESLAETQTTHGHVTRSVAAKQSATTRSRSNSLKKTNKAGNPKKFKKGVLEQIAKTFEQ
jgi:hypothetical protein